VKLENPDERLKNLLVVSKLAFPSEETRAKLRQYINPDALKQESDLKSDPDLHIRYI